MNALSPSKGFLHVSYYSVLAYLPCLNVIADFSYSSGLFHTSNSTNIVREGATVDRPRPAVTNKTARNGRLC